MNNDWLQGYLAACDNINKFLQMRIKEKNNYYGEGLCTEIESLTITDDYKEVEQYINQVKLNYLSLIKDLNEAQSKKS